MSSRAVDEETPLLHDREQKKGRTQMPWRQVSIILFLQFAEPLAAQVIAPFAPEVRPRSLPLSVFSFNCSSLSEILALRTVMKLRLDFMWDYSYASMISPFVRDSSCLCLRAVAFVIFCDASAHCAALEPIIRPYRPKTRHPGRCIRRVCFNVLFRAIQDLLGIGIKVTLVTSIPFPGHC